MAQRYQLSDTWGARKGTQPDVASKNKRLPVSSPPQGLAETPESHFWRHNMLCQEPINT